MEKNKKLVVANMKMNMNVEEISNYLKEINKHITSNQVVICPTSIYIPYFLKNQYEVGMQNTYLKSEGAYTGEVSPKQAISMGVRYTILGHSERRIHFHETDALIADKVKEALKYNMKVILCIGETLEEKEMLRTERVLKKQLTQGLRGITEKEFAHIVLAYEPVWAIGTGLVPTNEEIRKTTEYIQFVIKQNLNIVDAPVLYGGSVNEKNIKELNQLENLSGYLVGGASLIPDKFLTIIKEVVTK